MCIWFDVSCFYCAAFAGKCHTLSHAVGHGVAAKLAAYELHEIDEYKRARQNQGSSVNDSEIVAQLNGYEREVSGKLCIDS
jgi:hypothetical protein